MDANPISVSVAVPAGLDIGPKQMLVAAQSYTIDCPEMYEAAAEDLKAVKTKWKDIEAKRKEIVEPLNKAVKAVNDLFRAPLDYLTQAESVLKGALLTYDAEQERLRKIEQERLEAIARAEQARLRAEAEAAEKAQREARQEAERIEREAREKAQAEEEAARRLIAQAKNAEARAAAEKAAEAARIKAESERQAREIENARLAEEAREKAEIAQEKALEAQLMPAPTVQSEKPKVAGLSGREKYKAEVVDMGAFIKAVAERPELLGLVKVDESALNKLAGALKTALQIPGVRVYTEKTLASR